MTQSTKIRITSPEKGLERSKWISKHIVTKSHIAKLYLYVVFTAYFLSLTPTSPLRIKLLQGTICVCSLLCAMYLEYCVRHNIYLLNMYCKMVRKASLSQWL